MYISLTSLLVFRKKTLKIQIKASKQAHLPLATLLCFTDSLFYPDCFCLVFTNFWRIFAVVTLGKSSSDIFFEEAKVAQLDLLPKQSRGSVKWSTINSENGSGKDVSKKLEKMLFFNVDD
jgi:hypothetical protein